VPTCYGRRRSVRAAEAAALLDGQGTHRRARSAGNWRDWRKTGGKLSNYHGGGPSGRLEGQYGGGVGGGAGRRRLSYVDGEDWARRSVWGLWRGGEQSGSAASNGVPAETVGKDGGGTPGGGRHLCRGSKVVWGRRRVGVNNKLLNANDCDRANYTSRMLSRRALPGTHGAHPPSPPPPPPLSPTPLPPPRVRLVLIVPWAANE
jgi:hypothetical protein